MPETCPICNARRTGLQDARSAFECGAIYDDGRVTVACPNAVEKFSEAVTKCIAKVVEYPVTAIKRGEGVYMIARVDGVVYETPMVCEGRAGE